MPGRVVNALTVLLASLRRADKDFMRIAEWRGRVGFKFFAALLATASACTSVHGTRDIAQTAANEAPYDEIFYPDGRVRPEYERVYPIYQQMDPARRAQLRRQGNADFRGDNDLLPIPRVIDADEYDLTIRAGIEQRGRALQLFLEDVVSGRNAFLEQGLIPEPVWNRLVQKYQAEEWFGILKPDMINFWYGPDIVRDADGRFRIIEDNLGYVGGFGDLAKSKESLVKNAPEYADIAAESPDPHRFYKNLIDRYKARSKVPGGKVVLIQYVQNIAADNEPNRLKKLFQDEGIEIVRINIYKKDDKRLGNRLTVDAEGVWLEKPQGQGRKTIRERVGFVISDMEAIDLDPSHPAFRKRILDEAAAHLEEKLSPEKKARLQLLMSPDSKTGRVATESVEQFIRFESDYKHDLNRKPGVTGLWDAAVKGKVGISSTPMIDDLLGDKEFNMYVERLVRHYVGKEPILKGIPTRSFRAFDSRGNAYTDLKLVDDVFSNFDAYVVKRVDGRGGDAVWVGPKADRAVLPELRARVLADSGGFIVQPLEQLSRLDGNIIDIRGLAEVGGRWPYSGEIPWGRAASAAGDGKVNVSASGAVTTVFVLRTRRGCGGALPYLLGRQ